MERSVPKALPSDNAAILAELDNAMQTLNAEGQRLVKNSAARNGVSPEAAMTVLISLAQHGGGQAQFNHPDLGGIGQWAQHGMVMIGDMGNHGLKSRVDHLCNDLAKGLREEHIFSDAEAQEAVGATESVDAHSARFAPGPGRWPRSLGTPATTGFQNGMHYAIFPAHRRLAVEEDGKTMIYDTGEHSICGIAQTQVERGSFTLASQHGPVSLEDLVQISGTDMPLHAAVALHERERILPSDTRDDAIFEWIERLAALRDKEIVTQAEFEAKKAELLARL